MGLWTDFHHRIRIHHFPPSNKYRQKGREAKHRHLPYVIPIQSSPMYSLSYSKKVEKSIFPQSNIIMGDFETVRLSDLHGLLFIYFANAKRAGFACAGQQE